MRILGIETSCDETALSIIDIDKNNKIKILLNEVHSQIDIHKEYGGVFPTLAKREHKKILPHMIKNSLIKTNNLKKGENNKEKINNLKNVITKDDELLESVINLFKEYKIEGIDRIAITTGPGLSPALFVGINMIKALSYLYNIPIIPINHMEGHIIIALLNKTNDFIFDIEYPAIALLVSGGHTELVKIEKKGEYLKIGETLDDAVGETFDKVAKLLGLPYPGGPEISKLSMYAKENNLELNHKFPRPLLKDKGENNLNFSYSGLKTSVRVYLEKNNIKTKEDKAKVAREFEEAVIETLSEKLKRVIELNSINSIILGGGVSANLSLREEVENIAKSYGKKVYIPEIKNSTDNALMIALAGILNKDKTKNIEEITAIPKLTFNSI